jgi:hypothetical protein
MVMAKFVLGLLAGVGLVIAFAPASFAQIPGSTPNSADLLKDPQSTDSLTDLFNNRSNGSTTGLMQLIQQLSQSPLDPAAFRAQQRENLDAAAKAFRDQQRQRLQQTQTAPSAVTPPAQK